MGLTFGAANTDKVTVTSSSSLDNLAAFTHIVWFYPPTTAAQRLWGKNTTSSNNLIEFISAGTELSLVIRHSVSASSTNTNNFAVGTREWKAACFTFNDATSPRGHIYKGTLRQPFVECTYATQTDGSGTRNSDAGNNVGIGNVISPGTSAFNGRIAAFAAWSRVLSVGEAIQAQFALAYYSGLLDTPTVCGAIPPGHVLLHVYGGSDLENPHDYSPFANVSTITGAKADGILPRPLMDPSQPGIIGL
jgi:hypothetical protein